MKTIKKIKTNVAKRIRGAKAPKNRKLLVFYFNKFKIVNNVDEAAAFINTLHFHGNPDCEKLVCSENCKKEIQSYFDGERICWVQTTNCGPTRIMLFEPK